MEKLELYRIDLKNLAPGTHEYEYFLEDKFFMDVDGNEVHKGHVNVHLDLKRTSILFELNFRIKGTVIVPCDLCLEDVEIPVETQNKLIVKFGREYAEESDEIVVVPEEEGVIDIAWFLYEFLALAIPMKHAHASGQCNQAMAEKLRQHTAKSYEETGGVATDPRWDALKKILKNDNN